MTTIRHPVAVPALERGLKLLLILARSTGPMTLSELSDQIGVSRSTVYSLLATLHEYGVITKDERYKTYQLGIGALELGSAYLNKTNLLPAFNEVAQRLVAACGETVKLAVLDGRDVVYLGKQDGLYSVRLVARVGSRMPAHATAVGKVLLAQLSDAALTDLYADIPLVALTPYTITTFSELLASIRLVRIQGYALDHEESTPRVQCVAAPVRDHSSAVVAAISIGVPIDRLDRVRIDDIAGLVCQHAQELSRVLGWRDA
jgi:IclR family transcriptional regulator, KDG regulon repressor